jgi:hypothetical protein
MDLPKTMSLNIKTAKDTNNAQSQITFKLHLRIRRSFACYLYSDFDSLQTKKNLQQITPNKKTQLAVLKYSAMKSQKLLL